MPPPSESATPLVMVSKPRDPGMFSGSDNIDVGDKIKLYERVSTHNRWDPTIMLTNIIFYLKYMALVLKETHEAELTIWDVRKAKLTNLLENQLAIN